MTNINANAVKELREKTGAGMMDCKKALIEVSGNFEAAIDWLRKKGLAAASKKSGRLTAEGLIATCVKGNRGAIIELNSETDFVARNTKFQSLAKNLANEAIEFNQDIEAFKKHKISNGKTIEDEISEHVAVIGENLNLRRLSTINVNKGAIVSYVHNVVTDNLGKIGVLVALESEAPVDKLMQIGKQIAMHIAASRPESLSIKELDAAKIEREKSIFSEQALASGKPKEVVEKMVEGRIKKYYEEVVLLEQVFIIDGKTKISAFLDNTAKEIGHPIKLVSFIRYSLGEGLDKS